MNLRYLVLGAMVIAAAALGLLRLRRDPLRELFVEALPAWQVARAQPEGTARSEPARRMERLAARGLPSLVGLFAQLDSDWPDDAKVRATAAALNSSLRERGVPYYLDVQPVHERPVVLTYQREQVVPWSLAAGGRGVDVVRIRRLDHLNIEMGMVGETAARDQPVVYLDRVEAQLGPELREAWDPPAAGSPSASHFNGVDRAALAQIRRVLEERLGAAALGESVKLLAERERLFEAMRTRLHGQSTFIDHPERFVFGEEWADALAPYARFSRPGGPLIIDTDLRAVTDVDAQLADPRRRAPLEAAVDLFAGGVEAHEARHALDVPSGAPPPGELLDLLGGGDPAFATLADGELRAYLGELHDAPLPACLVLAECVRGAYGGRLSRTPHFFARRVLLARLAAATAAPGPPATPEALLDRLCALPDAELRGHVAAAWQELYGAPLPPTRRAPPR